MNKFKYDSVAEVPNIALAIDDEQKHLGARLSSSLEEAEAGGMLMQSEEQLPLNHYRPLAQISPRYRGQRDIDVNKWDEDVAARLLSVRRTPGDLCDCLAMCRSTLKLRRPPDPRKMADNLENGHPLPYGVVWFVRDPGGIVCVLLTWLFIGYSVFVVVFIALPCLPLVYAWITGIIFSIFTFLAIASHLKSVFTDPGSIRVGNATRDAVMRIYFNAGNRSTNIVRCPKCLCIKPERTHHCSCCHRCIRKMDHHCPWVNNCVGEGNQKYFILFNLYIFAMAISASFIVGKYIINFLNKDWTSNFANESFVNTNSTDFIYIIVLTVESGFFGLFTSIMGCSQINAMLMDETAVESLKRDRQVREKLAFLQALSKVFGHPPFWRWLSPFSPPPPLSPAIPRPGPGSYGGPTEEDQLRIPMIDTDSNFATGLMERHTRQDASEQTAPSIYMI